jgi:biotin carboxyl carrier protein
MTLEVEVNGRMRTVGVEPVADVDGRYLVTIDGQAQTIDARAVDSSTLSLILLDAGAACHEVELVDSDVAGELLVRTSDGLLRVIVDGRRLRRRGAESAAGLSGEQRVLAPMPGKIVRVLVAPGAEVQARQGVVVMEAMKMECELGAPKAGRVKEIAVEAGMSVEAGRVLAVVE